MSESPSDQPRRDRFCDEWRANSRGERERGLGEDDGDIGAPGGPGPE